jgi:hypothetical protein
LHKKRQILLQLKRTAHKIFELFVGEFHLLRHVRAVSIVDFPLIMANLGENAGLFAVVIEEVEIVIWVLFVRILEALF